MKKNSMLQTVLLSTVFAFLSVFILAPIASAHTATPAHRATISQVAASFPNVNIVIRHGKAVFSSTTVHCKARGLKKTCFTLSNLTNRTQKALFRGTTLIVIPPGRVASIRVSSPGMAFIGLKSNPQAILTIMAS